MLDLFGANNISLILFVALGAITVYYILTEGKNGGQNQKDYTDDTRKSEPDSSTPTPVPVTEKVEDVKQEEVKNVERKQSTSRSDVDTSVTEQTMNYQPTSTEPLPKINSVAVEPSHEATQSTVQQPIQSKSNEEEIGGELSLNDFETKDDEEIEVVCQWCDNVVKMRKGTSIVCPRCSGTIES